jgi:hypothetical protein
MSDFRPRIKGQMLDAWNNLTRKERRILVIGDLHEPFCLDGYLRLSAKTRTESTIVTKLSSLVIASTLITPAFTRQTRTEWAEVKNLSWQ